MADSSLTVGFRARGVQLFVRGTNTDGDRQFDSDSASSPMVKMDVTK